MDKLEISDTLNNVLVLLLTIVYTLIIGAIVVVLFYYCYFSNKQRTKRKNNTLGFQFEQKINEQLGSYAKVYNAEYLGQNKYKSSFSGITEIDGILVFNKFMVVVEVKYYIGQLVGNLYDSKIRLIDTKNKERKVLNPVFQNKSHIQKIRNLTRFDGPIYNLVICPKGASYNLAPEDNGVMLVTEDYLERQIEKFSVLNRNQNYKVAADLIEKLKIHKVLKMFIVPTKEAKKLTKKLKNKEKNESTSNYKRV
ncbi:nuclease-related domain-containing protein [Mycoplasma corogypsi]|uniref:nuclease-related domain-containing protein n=1 Tax=Mycoplasma corogypsi TaxID=2106 RepID=UPI0038736CB3